MQTNLSSEDRLVNRLKTDYDSIHRIISTEAWFWSTEISKKQEWIGYIDNVLYEYGWTYTEYITITEQLKWKKNQHTT